MHTKSWSGNTKEKSKKIEKQLDGRGYIWQSTPLTVYIYGEVWSRSLNVSSFELSS